MAEEKEMYSRKMAGRMKRTLAGVLAAGLVLTGMPTPVVEAANEVLEEQQTDAGTGDSASKERTGSAENLGTDGETGSPEGKEDGAETDTPDGGGNRPDVGKPGDGENSSDTDKPTGKEGSTDAGQPGGVENTPDDNTPGEEEGAGQKQENLGDADGTESETPQPGTEDPDGEEAGFDEEEEVTGEDVSAEASPYHVQVSGNDISGNDLVKTESDEVWITVEGGGSYQEGAFSVPDEGAGFRPRRAAAAERKQQSLAEVIYEALKKKSKETIDLSEYNLSLNDVRNLVIAVVNDHPELYYAKTAFRYGGEENLVNEISLEYIEDVQFDDEIFQQGVHEALLAVKPGMTELEKAIALHDYLALNCEYDKENYDKELAEDNLDEKGQPINKYIPSTSYSMYGVFAERIAVCQGYALAYKYLLDQVGIECYMVSSDAMNHAWNLIKLGDSYYQVDVTWDDPAWDRIGKVTHKNMFRSNTAWENETKHYDWSVTSGSGVVDLEAGNPQYDSAFWVDVSSPLVIADSSCYYTDYDSTLQTVYDPQMGAYITKETGGVIKKASLKDIENEGVTFHNIGLWTKFGNDNSYWQIVSSGLFQIGDRLYYNDKASIYSIKMDGSDQKTEFTADTTGGYIYGSAYCKGQVFYALHQSPEDEGKENVLTASLNTGGGETETYVIVYVLDGGKNDKANPTTYTADSEIIILQNAVRDGYVFGGWYRDETFSKKVEQIPKGSTENLKLYAKWVEKDVSLQDENIFFKEDLQNGLGYNGKEQMPDVVVKLADGTTLKEDEDYILSYENNRDAGTATVIVTGKGGYNGTASKTFEIQQALLTITARDIVIEVGTVISEHYAYDVEGLIDGDELIKKPSFSCTVNSDTAGEYADAIEPSGADAGSNYAISYKKGKLTVLDTPVSCTVTFDMQGHGHGTAPDSADYTSIAAGSKIKKPTDPTAEGYLFSGWYKDEACKEAWDFDKDTVTEDLTLYAGWKEIISLAGAKVSVVPDGADGFTYNGEEQKPKVTVELTGGTILTENADYTLSYQNNRNAGTATATVTGTGGYSGTVSRTFVIRPATLTIWAKDKAILINAPVPGEKEYEYGMDDLMPGDKLLTEPSFSCGITSTAEAGEYEIEISGADAGGNYVLSYLNGTLRVESEYDICTVTFDVQGHGMAPADYTDVKVGSTIPCPADPEAVGYRFSGWYRDAACTMAWNFDEDTVQADMTLYAWWVKENIVIRDEDVSLEEGVFVYDGTMQRPKVTVTVSGVVLVEGQDYNLTYENNRDAGTAMVQVLGINDCSGTAAGYFRIESRALMVRARDKTILRGGPIPAGNAYEYEVSGLVAGDALIREPSFSCEVTSSDMAGQYDIVPYGADAGKNYTITYEAGKLTVADEYVSCTVTFDMLGHGGAPMSYVGIKVGDTIDRPSDPAEAGYRFAGWYKDSVCTKAWDFENDVVQADLVLYAKWLQLAASGDEKGFAVQEAADLYYTGKPCKPVVSVYDGGMLLQAGKDYQIKYHNNIDANKGGIKKTGNGAGAFFNPELPYVEIIGKGNYAKKAEVNFNILRRPVGDGGADPASGVKLKVNDQLVTAAGKSLKPFVSIRYGKALRPDTDYTLKLTAVNAKDAAGGSITGEMDGAAVPAGYSGEFLLTIAGEGNYEGNICRTVCVADKAHLMKNTSVTLGKNQRNVTFTGRAVELNAAESDSADAFTVKYKGTVLRPGRDYTVSYRNHDRVGKAELILTGIGEYTGTKTVAFQIRGAKFSTNTVNVSGVEDKVYTGRAWTQNDAVLTYSGGAGQTLAYGVDYTISYRNNINKGTAIMTFKGREEAGYSGSFRKTFRIAAADISQAGQSESMKGLVFAYCKAGVKPVDEIILTNQNGSLLQNGRDYTLQYANNKAVADASDAAPPVVIVKGRGNYTGELRVPFGIVKADLRGVTVKTSPVAYKDNQPPEYAYKTSVRLTDGGTTLREGRDYLIAYQNNTQADLKKYIKQASTGGGAPVAVITGSESSPYRLDSPIVIPLPVYQEKFRKADMHVEFGNTLYTGSQVRPLVRVYYGGRLLVENADYTLAYGKNVKSGRNQGSVAISGVAPKYGGSVTVKFDIVKKDITY